MGTNRSYQVELLVSIKMMRVAILLLLGTLFTLSHGFSSPLMMPLGIKNGEAAQVCPAPMPNFELAEFLGDWYILEYEFASETKLTQLDCLGYKYNLNDLSDDMSVMVSNFTFRFPPKTGNMFHVPTFAIFSNDSKAKWNTNFRNVEMVSVVVDTDYSRWAVIAQCVKNDFGAPTFQSSRILSRERALDERDLVRAKAAIRVADVEGPYKYSIEQENCH